MSITYTNFSKIVTQALHDLLVAEFPKDIIVYHPDFRKQDLAKKGEYLRYYLIDDEHVSHMTMVETRLYNYELSQYFQYSGEQHKKFFDNKVSDRKEHLYNLLMNYRSYTGDNYKWHDLTFNISPIEWGFDGENKDICHIDIGLSIERTNQYNISDDIIVEEEIVIE